MARSPAATTGGRRSRAIACARWSASWEPTGSEYQPFWESRVGRLWSPARRASWPAVDWRPETSDLLTYVRVHAGASQRFLRRLHILLGDEVVDGVDERLRPTILG